MRLLTAIAFVGAVTASAQAGPVLTGSETFNAGTGLYTYSYTLDNSAGANPVTEFDVEVNPFGRDHSFQVTNPVVPNNWQVYPSFGSDAGGNPITYVTFSVFDSNTIEVGTPLAAGQVLSGFSFDSTFAPFQARYFTFDGSAEFGTVVGADDPTNDFGPPPSPEPSSLILAGLGLGGLLIARKVRQAARRRGRAAVVVSN